MTKLTVLGGLCFAGSAILLLFQTIGKMMKEDYTSAMLTLVDVVESKYLSWIDNIGFNPGRQAADFVVNMPLYQLLFALGILFFIFSMFFKGK